MLSFCKRRRGTLLGHDWPEEQGFDTVQIYTNLTNLRRKRLTNIHTDKNMISCGPNLFKNL